MCRELKLIRSILFVVVSFYISIVSAYAVTDDQSELLISFPGLSSVHIDVRQSDGLINSAIGSRVANAGWKTNLASFNLAAGIYDVSIRHGAATIIRDDVDCQSSHCIVDDLVTKLEINFAGLNSIHSDVWIPDGLENSIDTSKKVSYQNWKNNQANLTLLKGVYDIRVRQNKANLILDSIDCTASSCSVNDLTTTLKVHFYGLSSVHTDVWLPDGVNDQVNSSNKVLHKNWQNNLAELKLLKGHYDVRVRHGNANQVVDNIDCTQANCIVNDLTTTMTAHFNGLNSVHTDLWVDDGQVGLIDASKKVAGKNWQSNQAIIKTLKGIYDVRVRHGKANVIVDALDCRDEACSVEQLTSELTVTFDGQHSVHTDVWLPDGQANSIDLEAKVTDKNWQNDSATIKVLQGSYDVRVRKGDLSTIIDDVNCQQESCSADAGQANLEVLFTGLSSVHTDIWLADGANNQVSGSKITSKNWKTDQVKFVLFPGVFDVRVRHGKSSIIIDNVDCTQTNCLVSDLISTATVEFNGLRSIHTDVWIPDGINNSYNSSQNVTYKNWQTDQAEIKLLKGSYDFRVRQGKASKIIDDVDCNQDTCLVNNLVSTATVEFNGLRSIHTDVWVPDGNNDSYDSSKKVAYKNWQTDQAEIKLLKGSYDFRVRQGKASKIIDDVDCNGESCMVNDIVATATVNFNGLQGVHTDVWLPDGTNDSVDSSQKVTYKNWQRNLAEIKLLKGDYDFRVRQGKASIIIDDVNCNDASCAINDLVTTATVNFDGLNSIHTDVWIPDGNADSVDSSKKVSYKNWQNNFAELNLLRGSYDFRVRQGAAVSIIDDVDCTNESCTIDNLVANLLLEFPGILNVHTTVKVSDGIEGTAEGNKVTHLNWQSHQANIAVLREVFDLKVNHGETSIFDDIDCRSGSCGAAFEGNVQVTLIDGDRNQALAGKQLTAFEKLSNGELIETQTLVTSPSGQANFTLPDVGEKLYVIKAYNPLGASHTYYSELIQSPGSLDFIVTLNGENELDLEPPTVSISSPAEGGNVAVTGFEVSGFADDNRLVEMIELSVNDAVKGVTSVTVNYDANIGSWSATVPGNALTIGSAVQIIVLAKDAAQNSSLAQRQVIVVEDTEGPVITVDSHSDGDDVPVTGFLLTGQVTDLTQVQSLTATLVDPVLGTTIDQRILDVSANGDFALVVNNGNMTVDETIDLNFVATDNEDNIGNLSLSLTVQAVNNSDRHMINRITFGATPELLSEVQTIGADQYLQQQLDPQNIDDSVHENNVLAIGEPSTKSELQTFTILNMINSRRQLQEVMTWFFDNHFNTDIDTTRGEFEVTTAYELAENIAFRANALGNFRQLLEISAKSPAMLIYLDSVSNVVSDSNENYTREVLELHSMGVDGDYGHHDIEAGAEMFTGWTVLNDAFFFDVAQHNPEEQTFLGELIPAGGVEQGERMLDLIAEHRSTAEYLCGKMVSVFISDEPPVRVVTDCADRFEATSNAPNQIAQVLGLIMSSPEFGDIYRNKIKTPVEYIAGFARNLQANSNGVDLAQDLPPMGLDLYENPVPTGWSETGDDWINQNFIIERIKWVNDMAFNTPGNNRTSLNLLSFFQTKGLSTAEGISGYLLDLAMGDDVTDLERQHALEILNGSDGFDINDEDAELRLSRLVGAVMSYPSYQYQ